MPRFAGVKNMGFNDLKKTRQSCDTVRRRVVQTFLTPTFCEIICKSILFFCGNCPFQPAQPGQQLCGGQLPGYQRSLQVKNKHIFLVNIFLPIYTVANLLYEISFCYCISFLGNLSPHLHIFARKSLSAVAYLF